MNRFLLALATVMTVAAAEPTAPTYQGFAVTLPAGWVAWPKHQKPNHAMWGKIDRAYIRHTTIAEVRVSPPEAAKISFADLQSAMEQSLKRQPPARIKDFQFKLTQGTRRGTPTLEVYTQSLDTGVTPAAKLCSRGFTLITPDKRLLTATVSERSDQENFQFDEAGADEFLDAVSW